MSLPKELVDSLADKIKKYCDVRELYNAEGLSEIDKKFHEKKCDMYLYDILSMATMYPDLCNQLYVYKDMSIKVSPMNSSFGLQIWRNAYVIK